MNRRESIALFLEETQKIAQTVDQNEISRAMELIENIKESNGKLFILGVGGSAANASHAVNDFRKIAKIETYSPCDNVSELTAWTNDKGWEYVFEEYLKESKLSSNDALLIFSVGGGSENTSQNLVKAMKLAKERGSKILSVVSRDGGKAKELSDACILIPVLNESRITPHAEAWQGIVWHLFMSLFYEINNR